MDAMTRAPENGRHERAELLARPTPRRREVMPMPRDHGLGKGEALPGRSFMRMRYPVVAALALALAFPLASAAADSGTVTNDFYAGSGPPCAVAPDACPDIARAPSGDTVEIRGSGRFTVHPKMIISGSGTFTHKDANGNVVASGTWIVTELISFQSYGSGEAQGLPANFWGGQGRFGVLLTAGAISLNGELVVDCALGKVPGGAEEGVELLVPAAHINFNESVSGLTLYIRS
jgi:hypothetical protein